MRTENVQLGMLVRVHRGSKEPELRDRIGIVRERIGNHSSSPFEVQFKNKPLEMLWAGEFEEAEDFYEHYGYKYATPSCSGGQVPLLTELPRRCVCVFSAAPYSPLCTGIRRLSFGSWGCWRLER